MMLTGCGPTRTSIDAPYSLCVGGSTWLQVEDMGRPGAFTVLADDDDAVAWRPRFCGTGYDLTVTDAGNAPTYQVGVANVPALQTNSSYGMQNLTTDFRFLCPADDEAMLIVHHWRTTNVNDVSISLLCGIGAINTGGSGFRGWDFLPTGSSGHMRFRCRGSNGTHVNLNAPGAITVNTDHVMIVVREHGADKLHLWIDGGDHQSTTFDNGQSLKHASTAGDFIVGNYLGAANLDYAATGTIGDVFVSVRTADYTNEEVNRLGKYFANRYGVTWTNATQLSS